MNKRADVSMLVVIVLGIAVVAVSYAGIRVLKGMGEGFVGGKIPDSIDPSNVGDPYSALVQEVKQCHAAGGTPYSGGNGVFYEPCLCGAIRIPEDVDVAVSGGTLKISERSGKKRSDTLPGKIVEVKKMSEKVIAFSDAPPVFQSGEFYTLYHSSDRKYLGVSSDRALFTACKINYGTTEDVAKSMFRALMQQYNQHTGAPKDSSKVCTLGHFELLNPISDYSLEVGKESVLFRGASVITKEMPTTSGQRIDGALVTGCFLDRAQGSLEFVAQPITEKMTFLGQSLSPSVDEFTPEGFGIRSYRVGQKVTFYNVKGATCLDPIQSFQGIDLCDDGKSVLPLTNRLLLVSLSDSINDPEIEEPISISVPGSVELVNVGNAVHLRSIAGGRLLSEQRFEDAHLTGMHSLTLRGSVNLVVKGNRGAITVMEKALKGKEDSTVS